LLQADDDLFFFFCIEQKITLFRLVSGKGKYDCQGFVGLYPEAEDARIRGDDTGLSAQDGYGNAGERVVVLIQNFTGDKS